MNRAVFFDRDGVLNKLVYRDGGYYSPRKMKNLKLERDAASTIQTVKNNGYLCIVISNQPDIARGYLDKSVLDEMTKYLFAKLKFDDIFYCMHDDPDIEGVENLPQACLLKQKINGISI